MKNKKLDTLISLSPLVFVVLVPVGRYFFGKIIKKQEELEKAEKEKSKEIKEK